MAAATDATVAEIAGDGMSDESMHGQFVPGATLAGRYRIVSLLGRGGMGEVYRADDLKIGQAVALKFLPSDEAGSGRLELFLNEVRLARQISHPNVCRVYDIGEVDGRHFLSMEYVDGEDLNRLLHRIGRLPTDKGIQIARQLCAGLAAAHDKGVVHRDLKPANVMIDGRGHVRITDFGIAAIAGDAAASGKPVGTPAYMAPEQLAEGKTSVQSDLYSLGLILYELFTGTRMHKGTTVSQLLDEHEHASLTHPSSVVNGMDATVERVILRCLERRSQDRPNSARTVAAALPGGDPLAAAVAAGETPSPEMIAAAGDSGVLPMKVGASLLAAVALALIALPFICDLRGEQYLDDLARNQPAVLERDAHQWIESLGYPTPPDAAVGDSAFGYATDRVVDERGRFVDLNIRFWYRQHATTLDPHMKGNLYASAFSWWDITPINPPPIFPGMVTVRLDAAAAGGSRAPLLEFLAVPPAGAIAESSDAKPAAEWLTRVGLDANDFEPVAASAAMEGWRPPIHADHAAVYQHRTAEPPVQVVLATRGQRIVYFRRITQGQPGLTGMMTAAERRNASLWSVLFVPMLAFVGVLAFRNLRGNRSDTRGALRLALYYFGLLMLLWAVDVAHRMDAARESHLAADYTLRAMGLTLRLWLVYVALEPFARRIWPNMLITWSRVLAGRVRDPLIGRDLLVGCLFGAIITAVARLIGNPGHLLDFDAILSGRGLIARMLQSHQNPISFVIYALAILLLCRLVLRRNWPAGAALAVILTVAVTIQVGSPTEAPNMWLLNLTWAAGLVVLFVRFGLLCAIVGQTVLILLHRFPYTADFGAWFAGASFTAALVVMLVAAYGFYASTITGLRRHAPPIMP